MRRVACVPCRRFFRAKRNDFVFVEGMPISDKAKPGTEEPEKWAPYKLWCADLYECEGCGAQIISGVARDPLSEHYKPDFASLVESERATVQINDC